MAKIKWKEKNEKSSKLSLEEEVANMKKKIEILEKAIKKLSVIK